MNPFYYLFYIIYKLLMLQFKEDNGTEDMPGRVMGLISMMMLFHFFIIGSNIEKIFTIDLSFIVILLLLFYLVSRYYLRLNNRYINIIVHVEKMTLFSRVISICTLVCWFIILPVVLLLFC